MGMDIGLALFTLVMPDVSSLNQSGLACQD